MLLWWTRVSHLSLPPREHGQFCSLGSQPWMVIVSYVFGLTIWRWWVNTFLLHHHEPSRRFNSQIILWFSVSCIWSRTNSRQNSMDVLNHCYKLTQTLTLMHTTLPTVILVLILHGPLWNSGDTFCLPLKLPQHMGLLQLHRHILVFDVRLNSWHCYSKL